MAGTLDGKVAIVTGAGRGLGRVMTLGLLDAGARVAAAELDGPALEETGDAAEDRGAGERILDIVADVTRDDSGTENRARHHRAFRPRRHPGQQCRHQYRSAAPRRAAARKTLGDDAGGVPPHHRGQRRRRLPDDAGGAAGDAGAALGPHHQRDDEPRLDVARHDAALWRLQSRQRGDARGAWRRNSTAPASPPMCWCRAAPPTRAWCRAPRCRTARS